ncbi:MAG TPA: hypothetical protein VFI22_04165, partial [Thermomicrobiales bacterium]|nr:hypothetical protein [Thermomicrobiales bacterium]
MSEPGWTIGVDLGGTFLKMALLAPDGSIAARETVPTGGVEGFEAVLGRMADGARRLMEQAPAGAVAGI